MNQHPLFHSFDPSIQTNSQVESANVKNGPKTKADPTGKFDKLLILRGAEAIIKWLGQSLFKIIFLRSPFFMSNLLRSCYSKSKF